MSPLSIVFMQKGTEICNYSYPNTILAVRLNRVVSIKDFQLSYIL